MVLHRQLDEAVQFTYSKSRKQICILWTTVVALVLLLLGAFLLVYFILKVRGQLLLPCCSSAESH